MTGSVLCPVWVHGNTLLVLPKEATGNVLDPVWVHGSIILLLGGVVGGMLLSLQIGSNILRGTCQIYLLSPLRRRQFWQITLNILLVAMWWSARHVLGPTQDGDDMSSLLLVKCGGPESEIPKNAFHSVLQNLEEKSMCI